MAQYLENPGSSGDPSIFAPSIASRSTDLFEGDLCDDELSEIPSIMAHNSNEYEDLQLNPEDLVKEIEKEVQELAQSNASPTHYHLPDANESEVVPMEEGPAKEQPKEIPKQIPIQRKPVVSFVVQKLSGSQADNKSKKRVAEVSSSAPPGKVMRSTKTSPDDGDPPRITRSQVKKASESADEGVSAAGVTTKSFKEDEAEMGTANAGSGAHGDQGMPADQKAVVSDTSITGSASTASDNESSFTTKHKAAEESKQGIPVIISPVYNEEKSSKNMITSKAVETASLPPPSIGDKLTTSNDVSSSSSSAAASATATKNVVAKNLATKSSTPKRTNVSKGKAKSGVPVDTSTAHVKALTGENGASVCLGINSCDFEKGETEEVASDEAKKHHSNMTEEQRAQQSRDRNRRHARNTRLRKKAYVEELKQTLNELVGERDAAVHEKKQEALRESEQREVRFRVVEEFLNLRGRNEAEKKRWSAILADGFQLFMPSTPFQEMVAQEHYESDDDGQVLTGVEQVMEDSGYFANFLQTLGPESDSEDVTLNYRCDRQDFMVDGCNAVLCWNATTVGIVDKGAPTELTFRGSVKASFCAESNKLVWTDMVFDTYTILVQRDALTGPVEH